MAPAHPTCRHCKYFVDDPALIEAEFPNLTILGSAYSSARGEAGICRKQDTFNDPLDARQCPWFEPRPEPSSRT
jgi:hypothetical protein